MPVYVYEHDDEKGCDLGNRLEIEQPINDGAIRKCPRCGKRIHRIICPPMTIKSTRSDSDLKNMGFTKLIKRDKGVYENVTARDGESRIVEAGRPDTLPDLGKTITD